MKRKVLISSILLVAFILLAVGSGESKPKDPNAWKTENNSTMAYVMMQQFVEKQLKSPSTAKFPSTVNEEVKIVNKGNQTYSMVAFVDSQNSFGATIRTYFVGEIKQTSDDQWQLISLQFVEN